MNVSIPHIKGRPLSFWLPGAKSIEVLLRGYLFFAVATGERRKSFIYLTYGAAKRHADRATGAMMFMGWHLFKGWRGFRYRFEEFPVFKPLWPLT